MPDIEHRVDITWIREQKDDLPGFYLDRDISRALSPQGRACRTGCVHDIAKVKDH
jgi:hypothetical protein